MTLCKDLVFTRKPRLLYTRADSHVSPDLYSTVVPSERTGTTTMVEMIGFLLRKGGNAHGVAVVHRITHAMLNLHKIQIYHTKPIQTKSKSHPLLNQVHPS